MAGGLADFGRGFRPAGGRPSGSRSQSWGALVSPVHVPGSGDAPSPHLWDDISGRVQAEEDLRRHAQELEAARIEAINEKLRLEAVMEALPVGVAITDIHGGSISANRAYDQVWGAPRPATESVSDYAAYKAWWADTKRPLSPEEWASARVIEKGEPVVGQMLEIQKFDGSRALCDQQRGTRAGCERKSGRNRGGHSGYYGPATVPGSPAAADRGTSATDRDPGAACPGYGRRSWRKPMSSSRPKSRTVTLSRPT